jgi:hypothetical protein
MSVAGWEARHVEGIAEMRNDSGRLEVLVESAAVCALRRGDSGGHDSSCGVVEAACASASASRTAAGLQGRARAEHARPASRRRARG